MLDEIKGVFEGLDISWIIIIALVFLLLSGDDFDLGFLDGLFDGNGIILLILAALLLFDF